MEQQELSSVVRAALVRALDGLLLALVSDRAVPPYEALNGATDRRGMPAAPMPCRVDPD